MPSGDATGITLPVARQARSDETLFWALRGSFDGSMEHEERAYFWFGRFLYVLQDGVQGAAMAHLLVERNADLAADAAEAHGRFSAKARGKAEAYGRSKARGK